MTAGVRIIHLFRNTFRQASRKYWDQISHDLRPIYTADTPTAARRRYEELAEKWGTPHPAIKRLWGNAWEEFIPFLDYEVEIRKVLCSTVLDTLVDAGVARSRSEALSWAVKLVGEHADSCLADLRGAWRRSTSCAPRVPNSGLYRPRSGALHHGSA